MHILVDVVDCVDVVDHDAASDPIGLVYKWPVYAVDPTFNYGCMENPECPEHPERKYNYVMN